MPTNKVAHRPLNEEELAIVSASLPQTITLGDKVYTLKSYATLKGNTYTLYYTDDMGVKTTQLFFSSQSIAYAISKLKERIEEEQRKLAKQYARYRAEKLRSDKMYWAKKQASEYTWMSEAEQESLSQTIADAMGMFGDTEWTPTDNYAVVDVSKLRSSLRDVRTDVTNACYIMRKISNSLDKDKEMSQALKQLIKAEKALAELVKTL